MKKIIFHVLLICLVSSTLCAAKNGIGRELSRSSSTSFEFQAIKNGPIVDQNWEYKIEVTDLTGSGRMIAGGEELNVSADILSTKDWCNLFEISYSSNSLKYPIRFNVMLSIFTNGDDVIPTDGKIESKYGFEEDGYYSFGPWGVSEDSFKEKYFGQGSSISDGEQKKGYGDSSDKNHLIFNPLEIRSSKNDEKITFQYGRTYNALFKFNAVVSIRLDEDAPHTTDGHLNQTVLSGGEYRMNVLLTVEAEA